MRTTRTLGALTALALVATLAGTALAEVNLTGAGATFPYPLYSKWFDVYQKETGVKINYQSIGSGAGIQQVKAGTVDFGASDAALSNQRLKEMPRAVLHFPTAAGAVVLAYNLDGVSQPINLTSDIVAGIYLGKVTQWNDKAIAAVNPGVALPPSPILAVHRSDGSGTTNIFTTYLSVVSRSWKELVGANTSVSWPVGIGGKGNEGVAGLVRQTPGSIGYVELAYAKQNHLAYAHVRNAAGKFIEPTLASTTAAAQGAAAMLAKDVRTPIANSSSPDAYPIAGMTFLLVYKDQKDADKGKALVDFIRWANSKGQEINETLEYARLPEPVVKVNEATLMQLRVAGRPIAAAQ
jgi:phosphate transport system substrate-binding protein